MESSLQPSIPVTLKPNAIWLMWIGVTILLGLVYRVSIDELVLIWSTIEEYSHGFFIPCITLYLLWIRRSEFITAQNIKESGVGLGLMLAGLGLFLLGNLAAITTLEQYAFLITLIGLFAVVFGVSGLKKAAVPLLFLAFMIPFPNFIINNLSSKLQLISSWLGVAFIRSCDIMVYLEGNVIDLGSYKLQVVDACSGLRYLFPLSSLAFLCAYLFKGPFWQKALIFLSSLPLTVFMNSFRIGVIGVMVDNWGTEMAEGFLHDFEGWAVFLMCMALLFAEMWLLSRISGKKLAFSELVQIPEEWLAERKEGVSAVYFNKAIFLVVVVLLLAGGAAEKVKHRVDIIPQRQSFLNFPRQIGNWAGPKQQMDKVYLKELKLTDYVIVNYRNETQPGLINFYTAYYQSQRKNATVHSPRSCIPGDGWQITKYEQKQFPNIQVDGNSLQVNRAIIEKGETRQLVYFWFMQRGRSLTNEYLLKWFLFYDAIMLNRTDGALVRIVTPIEKNELESDAEQRLQGFLTDLVPLMSNYIPGKTIQTAGFSKLD